MENTLATLKLHRTRVGDFVEDVLGKAPSVKILSRKERIEAQKLHRKVILWAAANLDQEKSMRFSEAISAEQYNAAYRTLMDAFHENGCVTLRQLRRWDRWIKNFDRGFIPS